MQPPTKPLPAVPELSASEDGIPPLTPVAREHLRKIVSLAVIEEGLAASWTPILLRSIQDVGPVLSQTQCLSGIRIAKKLRRQRLQEIEVLTNVKAHTTGKNPADTAESEVKKTEDSSTGNGPPHAPRLRRRAKDHDASDFNIRALSALHNLTSSAAPSSSTPSIRHLLLTLAAPNDSLSIPGASRCTFVPNEFALPFFEIDDVKSGSGGVDISGIETWNSFYNQQNSLKHPSTPMPDVLLVGGTFHLSKVLPKTYDSLARVLRISVYAYLSCVLELCLLRDSGVQLRYPLSPGLPPIPLPEEPESAQETHQPGRERRTSAEKLPAAIWSFITKRTAELKHLRTRSSPVNTSPPHTTKLLTPEASVASPPSRPSRTAAATSRPALGIDGSPTNQYVTALQSIRNKNTVLSTSPSVHIDAPPLLVRLAREEQEVASHTGRVSGHGPLDSVNRSRKQKRIPAIDKAALSSLLGWKSDGSVPALGGVPGFIRHQSITVLYASPLPKASTIGKGKSPSRPPPADVVSPHTPRLHTYRYYDESEATLGMWIEEAFELAEEVLRKDSETNVIFTWCHASLKIIGHIDAPLVSEREEPTSEEIRMFHSCTLCEAQSAVNIMGDGTYLFDFGKFLELVFYTDYMNDMTSPFCPHTSGPPTAPSSLGADALRFCLVRHFSLGRLSISFKLFPIHDILHVRIPRTQMINNMGEIIRKSQSLPLNDEWLQMERDKLRLDMTFCWKSLKDHLHWLEDTLSDGSKTSASHKRLPSTPPFSESPESVTPTATFHDSHSSKRATSEAHGTLSDMSHGGGTMSFSTPLTSSSSSLSSLSSLRGLIVSAEHSLYTQLGEASLDSLSDVRRAFMSSVSDTFQRLYQFTPPGSDRSLQMIVANLPDWWSKDAHCLPNSGVIVRESEWGSIISFTLRSVEYQTELEDMTFHPTTSTTSGRAPAPNVKPSGPSGTFAWGSKNGSSSSSPTHANSIPSPAPGSLSEEHSELILNHELEDFYAVISRKENPRDVSSFLSIRDVLLNRRSLEPSVSSSKFGSLGSTASRLVGRIAAPPAAWAKPEVQISLHVAEGTATRNEPLQGEGRAIAPSGLDTHLDQAQLAGFSLPQASGQVLSTSSQVPPSLDDTDGLGPRPTQVTPVISESIPHSQSANPGSSDDGTLGSTFSAAVRYMLNQNSTTKSSSETTLNDTAHRLALLGIGQGSSPPHADDKPHVQYDFVVGNRLRFSCTAYYALQFRNLRKQCDVEETLLRSLERTMFWVAQGGKSKSTFFKTSDDRFILKTLVTAWNVADLQALLELAPAYFGYMNQMRGKPSTLAKLLGFYTIEIKNLETGNTGTKADILVMENLFYSHKIDAVYDLKGIKGRKVKGDVGSSKTLLDQEWIERQRHSPVYIYPQSKHVLQEALTSDAEFLAENNIMDYSLLVGIDSERKELICGLVDTFGTYTLAKTIESKAKHGLKTDKEKEVTIIPPSEYQARFLKAIDKYFLPVPDKWSKPVGNKSASDFFRIAQVL